VSLFSSDTGYALGFIKWKNQRAGLFIKPGKEPLRLEFFFGEIVLFVCISAMANRQIVEIRWECNVAVQMLFAH
jgi:hypothetical protein